MKHFALLMTLLTGGLLVYGTLEMPRWGDPHSPAALHVNPRYIEKTLEETATPGMVTSVLGDYRAYDTLGEATMILAAGIACLMLLRRDNA